MTVRASIIRALKFVRFSAIEDHFRRGWMIAVPNAPMHHHVYGVEMKWICDCPIPGLKNFVSHRVPASPTESAHERARAGS